MKAEYTGSGKEKAVRQNEAGKGQEKTMKREKEDEKRRKKEEKK